MDTLTHAVIGALALRIQRSGDYANQACSERIRIAVVAGASIFPDLDYAGFLVDPYRFITEWHRGISHSLLMLPLWAVFLGLFFSVLIGRSDLRSELIRLSALGLLLHILFDLITVYGTQVFAPWSDYRVAFGLTFDVDFWIAMIAAVSLLLSFYRRVFARCGLAVLGLYLGLALFTQFAALRVGESRFGGSTHRIHTIAHPLSPLHRILVVETDSGYWQALLTLYNIPSRFLDTAIFQKSGLNDYRTEKMLRWEWRANPGNAYVSSNLVTHAWRQPQMQRLRRFAALPVLYRIDRHSQVFCVWFTDLRYAFPGIMPPFRYGMCRDSRNSDWHAYRLRRFTKSERESIE